LATCGRTESYSHPSVSADRFLQIPQNVAQPAIYFIAVMGHRDPKPCSGLSMPIMLHAGRHIRDAII